MQVGIFRHLVQADLFISSIRINGNCVDIIYMSSDNNLPSDTANQSTCMFGLRFSWLINTVYVELFAGSCRFWEYSESVAEGVDR